MPASTWITTYPKSGTTWVRFLVHRLLNGPFASTTEVDDAVPNIHNDRDHWRAMLSQGGGVLATHKRREPLEAQYGPCVEGFVHVVRHPADVYLSEARYYCLQHAGRLEGQPTPERLDEMFRQHLTVMLTHGEFVRHQRLGIGSWGAHAGSWLAARADHPHLLVRYEDLHADPQAEVRRLAAFFGIDVTDPGAVAADCDAVRMRGLQERDVRAGRATSLYQAGDWDVGYRMGLRFVGRAEVGPGLDLGDEALQRLVELFGPTMECLGYGTTERTWVAPRAELRRDTPLSQLAGAC